MCSVTRLIEDNIVYIVTLIQNDKWSKLSDIALELDFLKSLVYEIAHKKLR